MKLRQESGSAENEVTMQRLQTKVALVTGASMGFGAAIARRFGLEGAAVIVNYPVNESEAEKVVFDIVTSGGRAKRCRPWSHRLSRPLDSWTFSSIIHNRSWRKPARILVALSRTDFVWWSTGKWLRVKANTPLRSTQSSSTIS
jgi:short chain dehydrogenase